MPEGKVSWRPKDWMNEISFEEISKIHPRLVSIMTIKEKKLYEAGADDMLQGLSKLKIIEVALILDEERLRRLK